MSVRSRWSILAAAIILSSILSQNASTQVRNWQVLPDPRGEFVRLCAQHMANRARHPETVCLCLHDYALATVSDADLHNALMRGISETGVPTIENAWIPPAKLPLISSTFSVIARPTFQCMFAPE